MKNYIQEFMDDNNLKDMQEFRIGGDECVYRFDKCVFNKKFCCTFEEETTNFFNLLTGKLEVIYLPFKPRYGEQYWCASPLDLIHSTTFAGTCVDFLNCEVGNCFKTKEQAKINKHKIMVMFDEIRQELGL